MNLCSIILVLLLSFFNSTNTYTAEGKASYYADRMHGQRTASGEKYDKTLFTAAHPSLPFDTQLEITNPKNGKTVVVRVNDRMPRNKHRVIDLSRAAAEEIGIVRAGIGYVKIKAVPIEQEKQQEVPLAVSRAESSSK
ncbi:septal ring lytic transglycosylase RlpA family protein [Pontibacter sp. MBLB2868]|uniref:septal ring lytic transglycosylase RlpA family protein n=1 Tax=Pontibacter sp. MBLB2868 TaxID=3451555 RepID=UPI003F74BC4B